MSPRIQHSGHEPGEAWGKRRKVATDHEEDRDRSQHVEGSQPLSCLAESDSAASWLGRRGGMHGRLRVPAGGPLGPLCRGSCFHACIPEEPGSGTSTWTSRSSFNVRCLPCGMALRESSEHIQRPDMGRKRGKEPSRRSRETEGLFESGTGRRDVEAVAGVRAEGGVAVATDARSVLGAYEIVKAVARCGVGSCV